MGSEMCIRDSNTPTQYVVNLACLEGIKVESFADAPWFDGREHPKDLSNKQLEKENHR